LEFGESDLVALVSVKVLAPCRAEVWRLVVIGVVDEVEAMLPGVVGSGVCVGEEDGSTNGKGCVGGCRLLWVVDRVDGGRNVVAKISLCGRFAGWNFAGKMGIMIAIVIGVGSGVFGGGGGVISFGCGVFC
jgi:hypothetical protein